MTHFCCWLVDLLCRMLEPAERDAVRGDLAESGVSVGQGLRDVLGLVVRRQVALWQEWQSWVSLGGFIIPLGVLLTLVSHRTADGSAVYLWLYANNWTWTYLTNAGARDELLGNGGGIVISWIVLMCWAWSGGLLLGYLSRRTIWSNVAFLSFGLLLAAVFHPPPFIESLFSPQHDRFGADPNGAVFAVTFYRVVFPLIVQYVLVLLPLLFGMRQALRTAVLPFSLQTILWISAIASMTSLITQNSLWWQVRTWQTYPLWLPRLPSLHLMAAAGPIGYIMVTAIFRWSSRKTTAMTAN